MLKTEGTYVHIQVIPFVVQQKLTQYKAIIPLLENKF